MGREVEQIRGEIERRLDEFVAEIRPTFEAAAALLENEIRKQASLRCHTLKDLRRMGHPYRIKGGGFAGETKKGGWRAGIRKKAREQREGSLGHDIKLVHIQSGDLQKAIYSNASTIGKKVMKASAGVDPRKEEYIEYVIKGTRNMIPRDFVGRAAIIARPKLLKLVRMGVNRAAKRMLQR